ncbi:TrbI/VirB10 family protein [Sphingopyxis sp.]|uniref:TrbI/VirB10 family protein n=1 Tax=Sphingopyxis sp. TaxID=1908224 RepID=UPI002D7A13A0|nr:TrbI/VirB10 family protein [Sphingopyxis sp.]HET6523586.1 TrbI/VirB10 family protein [Sphingopyxis sp.]
MRLSRKTIAGAAASAGLAIGAALLFAFQPEDPGEPDNLYTAEARSRPDVLNAEAGYDAVPQAPRPGDLGPVQSVKGDDGDMPPIGPPVADPRSAADPAQERAADEAGAARSSRLFFGGAAMADGGAASAAAKPAADAAAPAVLASAPPASRQQAFLAPGARATDSPERVRPPASAHILQAGSLIPAALITSIRSDLPGQITAQVTENVYDSPTGQLLLIPQGSRLIGEYDSEIAAGQNRVLLAWDRLLLPGGRSIALPRLPGADPAGMSGLSDRTDYHWGQMLRAALVSTLLGVGTELASDEDDRLVRALREGTQDSVNQTGRRLVERQIGIPPTLTVRPGHPLRVVVTRDLIFDDRGAN